MEQLRAPAKTPVEDKTVWGLVCCKLLGDKLRLGEPRPLLESHWIGSATWALLLACSMLEVVDKVVESVEKAAEKIEKAVTDAIYGAPPAEPGAEWQACP